MTCSCPKCAAYIEVDLTNIPEDGTYTPCPECKSRFWINRESYARRALKREGKLYCDKCGNELFHAIVCKACGVTYPDYYLIQAVKPAKRQVEKAQFTLSFSRKPTQTQIYTYAQVSPQKSLRSLVIGVGLLMLVIFLAVAGTAAYRNMQAEKSYKRYFVLALYEIKSGTDKGLEQCAKISSDWKAKMDAGQKSIPRLAPDEETKSSKLRDEIDAVMQRLSKPPKKFSKINESVAKLYGVYASLYSLTLTPPADLQLFTEKADKVANDYKQAVQGLKADMPPELSAEVEKAKTKYKGLRDF